MDDINSFLIHYRKSGEKEWFEKIYYYFMPKIYNYFYFRTLDKQTSEDLASEVFLKVYKNLNTKKFDSKSFQIWIYKIAKNQLIDYFRKTKEDNKIIQVTDWLEYDNLQDENLLDENFLIKNSVLLKKEFAFEDEKLIEAMKKLTQLQKFVIFLIFVMDFNYEIVANILTKKQSTVRGIVFRALNTLKSEIRND